MRLLALLIVAWASSASAQKAPIAVEIRPLGSASVAGELELNPVAGGVQIEGVLRGLAPNSKHGFHVHSVGVCSGDGSTAGDHWNPTGKPHGAGGQGSHLGDMGNISADKSGTARVSVLVPNASLEPSSPTTIRGKAIIVHQGEDDLKSQPAGASGPRIACGVIP